MTLTSLLERLPGLNSLPSFSTLFAEINADMGDSDIWVLLFLTCLMLAFHGLSVLSIAGIFHWIDQKLENKRVYGANFVSYFFAILLIIAIHLLGPIFAWDCKYSQPTCKPCILPARCTRLLAMVNMFLLSAGGFSPLLFPSLESLLYRCLELRSTP
jgi:hypothetical protein